MQNGKCIPARAWPGLPVLASTPRRLVRRGAAEGSQGPERPKQPCCPGQQEEELVAHWLAPPRPPVGRSMHLPRVGLGGQHGTLAPASNWQPVWQQSAPPTRRPGLHHCSLFKVWATQSLPVQRPVTPTRAPAFAQAVPSDKDDKGPLSSVHQTLSSRKPSPSHRPLTQRRLSVPMSSRGPAAAPVKVSDHFVVCHCLQISVQLLFCSGPGHGMG